jgi:hypothetical protein
MKTKPPQSFDIKNRRTRQALLRKLSEFGLWESRKLTRDLSLAQRSARFVFGDDVLRAALKAFVVFLLSTIWSWHVSDESDGGILAAIPFVWPDHIEPQGFSRALRRQGLSIHHPSSLFHRSQLRVTHAMAADFFRPRCV